MGSSAVAPSWPDRSFWLTQSGILLVTGLLMLWGFAHWPIDSWLIAPFAGDHLPFFVHRDDWALTRLAHDGIKKMLFVIGLGLAVPLIGSVWREQWRVWRWPAGFVLLGMILGPSVVGLLKASSAHSCPWHLTVYGGAGGVEYPLFGTPMGDAGQGKCLPGGHAAGGFGVMAFYFVARAAGIRSAWRYALAGGVLGMGMGTTQMMRGAHFLSHNLWSAWVVWATLLLLFALMQWLAVRRGQSLAAPVGMLSGGAVSTQR
jgi:membrane-associated PAP2 superfamily phosphatase